MPGPKARVRRLGFTWVVSSVGYLAEFLGSEQQDIGTTTGNDLRRFISALRDKPKFANHPYNKPQQAKLSAQSIETYCRAIMAFFGFLPDESLTAVTHFTRPLNK